MGGSRSEQGARNERAGSGKRAYTAFVSWRSVVGLCGGRSGSASRGEVSRQPWRFQPSAVGRSAVCRGGRVGSAGSARLRAAGWHRWQCLRSVVRLFSRLACAPFAAGGGTAGGVALPPLRCGSLFRQRCHRQRQNGALGIAEKKSRPPSALGNCQRLPASRPEPSRASRPDPTATADG